MAIIYTWGVTQLDCIPSLDGLTDVVQTVHWTYDAVDGIYTADSYGTQNLAPPDPMSYIPYDQLTEQEVINWLEAVMPVEQMQANLAKMIENQINPPIVTPPLPWNNPV